jgi:acetylornithine/succinyldiaminopimelate/putrescine aminotransferase
MQQALNELKEKYPIVHQVYGLGLLWALELQNTFSPGNYRG